ncbi:MAG TPA: hypothetical protein PLW50_00225 [Smithellaceae bacterium]|nr:hypothetical protein [Smithellaceae bacterium]
MNRKDLNAIELTEIQKQIIMGTLLGDGYIAIEKSSINPHVCITHSIKQKEYCEWIHLNLSNLCPSKPKVSVCSDGTGKQHQKITFSTRRLICLKPIYDCVIVNGRKTITEKWIDSIYHPISLALWYLDDGFLFNDMYKSRNMQFALGDRTSEESELLQEWLKCKFGISSESRNRGVIAKNGERIKDLFITEEESMIKLKSVIEPYVIPSMKYKIDLYFDYRPSLQIVSFQELYKKSHM